MLLTICAFGLLAFYIAWCSGSTLSDNEIDDTNLAEKMESNKAVRNLWCRAREISNEEKEIV